MSLESIYHFIQVTDRIASSGLPNRKQFEDIASNGFKLVVNLAMPDSKNALLDEDCIVTLLGVSYIHIPVPFDAPTASQLRQFINVMNAYSEQKIWVHCVANYRVSAFLYQYLRFSCGYSDSEASKAILASWEPNEVWQQFLDTSIQSTSHIQ